jgi:ribose 5-phosphate isomerase A
MSSLEASDALAKIGREAAALVMEGARVGLGTGRAAEAFIRALGARVREERLVVVGVATSERSAELAAEVGIAVEPLSPEVGLDLAFDGADEVAPDLSLTKGLGGAMLRERVVATDARRFLVLVTPEKLVQRLGERSPLPIEVVPFALPSVERARVGPSC